MDDDWEERNRLGWLALNPIYGLKAFVVEELADAALKDKTVEDQIFRISISLTGLGHVGDREAIEHRIDTAKTLFKPKNFEYHVHEADKEVGYPDDKLSSFRILSYELRTTEFAVEAARRAHNLLAEKKRSSPAVSFVRGPMDSFIVKLSSHNQVLPAEEKPSQHTKPFIFEDLAPELRRMIYDCLLQGTESALTVHTYQKFTDRHDGRVKRQYAEPQYDSQSRLHWSNFYCEIENQEQREEPKNIWPVVLRLNKKIYSEALPSLYKYRSFDFGSNAASVAPLFSTVSPKGRLLIPRISLPFHRIWIHTQNQWGSYHTTYQTNVTEWTKAVKFMADAMPNTKLVAPMLIDADYLFGRIDDSFVRTPFARALFRLNGIKMTPVTAERFKKQFEKLYDGGENTVLSTGCVIRHKFQYISG
ncbi:MAG: hypothetical protein Q9201_005669 [Fulgogasparrea decipioides]